jgi:hypothetical protein
MRNQFGYILALVTLLAVGLPVKGQQSTQSANDTFTWVSELVSVDGIARTMTVKSRIAYQEALSGLKQFKAGEPVWVVWSGVSDHSDAVWQFRRPNPNNEITERLVTRAELVSPEVTNQYVTLRVKVPEAGLSAIRSLKPGEWVTVTSRRHPASEADAIVGVRPYVESSTPMPRSTN